VTPTEFVSEIELNAYVDEQLDIPRRIEVEDHLARHPCIAARVMADLRARDMLRLILTAPRAPPDAALSNAARRLGRSLRRVRLIHHSRRAAVAVAFVAAGWVLHAQVGTLGVTESEASPPPPAYVADAVRAHRTAQLRARMRSQPEASNYDPDEIHQATQIVMPTLPRGWRVLDVQVFPTQGGPSVEMTIETGQLGALSLFAVRIAEPRMTAPAMVATGAEQVAHWRAGHLAYALTGPAPESDLEQAARQLAANLN
jgi:anti-sigma factor RsiW